MKTLILIPIVASVLAIAAAGLASAQIWRWVDQDGTLTFSNIKPPVADGQVTPVFPRSNEDASRGGSGPDVETAADKTSMRAANQQSRDERNPPWRSGPQPFPDSCGEALIAEDQAIGDEPDEACEFDCGDFDRFYPYTISYAPYTDYAYSRRYYQDPRRPLRKYRYGPHHRRHNPYGDRRYDRLYYSSSYRYRARLPHDRRGGENYYFGGYGGRPHGNAFSAGRNFRGFKTRAEHGWGARGQSGTGHHR